MAASTVLQPEDDVVAWLAGAASDDWARDAADVARAQSITAAALLACGSEAEAASLLGISKFGPKRKLWILLKPSVDAFTARRPVDLTDGDGPVEPVQVTEDSAARRPVDLVAGRDGRTGEAAASSASVPERDGHSIGQAPAQNDELADESFALGNIQWVGEKLHKLLSTPDASAWARPNVRASKLDELAALRKHTGLPGVHVVVCGNTGAGKSTLLNALLRETSVRCRCPERWQACGGVRAPPVRSACLRCCRPTGCARAPRA